MKKFKFNLESLLELREKQLEEKQIEFGKVQFELKKLETELSVMNGELNRAKENLDALIEEGVKIDVDIISANQNYITRKEYDIYNQNKLITQKHIEVEQKQKEMIEALKAKTMLEKLKEKKYKEFLKEFEVLERKELDEIGLNRYAG